MLLILIKLKASLVLSKVNKIDPNNLAKEIKKLLLKNINHFEVIEIAGPGFLNIKLSKEGLASNINEIFHYLGLNIKASNHHPCFHQSSVCLDNNCI